MGSVTAGSIWSAPAACDSSADLGHHRSICLLGVARFPGHSMTRSATPLAGTNQTSGLALQWLDFRAKQKDRVPPLYRPAISWNISKLVHGTTGNPIETAGNGGKEGGVWEFNSTQSARRPAATIMGRPFDRPMSYLIKRAILLRSIPTQTIGVPPVHRPVGSRTRAIRPEPAVPTSIGV